MFFLVLDFVWDFGFFGLGFFGFFGFWFWISSGTLVFLVLVSLVFFLGFLVSWDYVVSLGSVTYIFYDAAEFETFTNFG